jgi:hypothetical protein
MSFAPPGRIVLDIAPPPTDVAPPPTLLAGVGWVVLAALCALVIVIGVVAFFVIRAVRKNRLAKQAPPPTQEPPQNS